MTKSTTEQFLQRAGTPKHTEEAHLASAFVRVDQALGEQKIRLVNHLSAARKNDKVVPIFDDGVEAVLPDLEVAKAKADEVTRDVGRYLELLQDQPSIAGMTETLGRVRIVIRNAEFDSKALLEREVRTSKKDAAECMTLPDVVDSFAHSEKVAKENQPKIDDLLARIAEARQILEKY